MRIVLLASLVAASTLSSLALAAPQATPSQTATAKPTAAAPPAAKPAATPAATTTPATTAASATTPSAAPSAAPRLEAPKLPSVTDPMLEPVAPAPQNLATWEQAVTMLKSRSVELKSAYNEIRRAEGAWRSSLALALTTVTANATGTHNLLTNPSPGAAGTTLPGGTTVPGQQPTIQTGTRVPEENILQGGLFISQPVVNVATWHNIGTADDQINVARMSLEDTKRIITTTVANGVVTVVVAERVAELNRSGLRSALERLELTQKRFDLGTQTALDVARARQDVEVARATLVNGDEALRQSREALGLALGTPTQMGVDKSVRLQGLADTTIALCKGVPTIEERPDLQAQAWRVSVAERQHDNVGLQFLPTLNAVSQLNTTSLNQGSFPNTTWSIQGVLSIPLWEGGNRYGLLKQTDAVWDTTKQTYEGSRRKAVIEVTQARRSVDVATDALGVATRARDLATEVDRLTQLSFQEGRGTSLELVTAASSLRTAEITLAQRELDLVRARILAVVTMAKCNW